MPDPQSTLHLAVSPSGQTDQAAALALAQRLNLPLASPDDEPPANILLLLDGPVLALQLTGKGAPGPVSVDFAAAAMRHRRRSGANELLGRAVGVTGNRQPRIMDATAGLGTDAFVLADLGCELLLYERNRVIGELLQSGLAAARGQGDPWLDAVLSRMRLSLQDAREATLPAVDVIYLDPMFPVRGKSAAVKKEMVLFQMLLQDVTDDSNDLLQWALAQDVARIVVKRPAKAAELDSMQPSHCIRGKAVRYDVYVRRALDPALDA